MSKVLLFAFFLSGFAAIALEVLWTRLLTLVIGGSTYAFTLVLVAFLLGIGLGALLIAPFARKSRKPLLWFAVSQIALGLAIVFLTPLFFDLPVWFLDIYTSFGKDFGSLQLGLFFLALLVMLVPTLLMGAAFPLALRAYARSVIDTDPERMSADKLSRDGVGIVYAVNTIGGVFGSLFAGFLFIPVFGLHTSMLLAALLYLLIGCGLLLIVATSKKMAIAVTAAVLGGLGVVGVFGGLGILSAENTLLTAGFYKEPEAYFNASKEDLLRRIQKSKRLYEKEGVSAHVAVTEDTDGVLSLKINGKADASSGSDMENQLLAGHLPMLLHSHPKDALVVGLGSGITLGAILSYPVQTVDAIEIEESVVEAARFFANYNNHALSDKRTRIIVADGRNFLSSAQKKYDVISSEPSNAWLSGSAKLFTKEYFQLLQSRIKKDGVVVHWLDLYALDIDGAKRVIAAYREVFPEVLVFGIPSSNDVLLIGANTPLRFDTARLQKRLANARIKQNLAKIDIQDSFEVFAYFLLDDSAVLKLVGKTRANTDNHPSVEFSAPKNLYAPQRTNPWRVLYARMTPFPDGISLRQLADRNDKRENELRKAEAFRKARLLTHIALTEKNIGEGIKQGEKALTLDPDNPYLAETVARLYFEQGVSLFHQEKYVEAVTSFERSLELRNTAEAQYNLAITYDALENTQKALEHAEAAVAKDSTFETGLVELGELQAKQGDLNNAIGTFEKVVTLNPKNTDALLQLGNLYLLRSDFGKAEAYLRKTLELDPNREEAAELLRKIP